MILSLAGRWLRLILGSIFRPKPKPPEPAPPPSPPSGPDPLASIRADLVTSLNASRAARALPALAEDPRLDAIAQAWSESMAASRLLSHGNFQSRVASVYPGTAAAEDIAEGYPTVDSVVAGWMADPPHRANILGSYARVGAGMARDRDGNLWWTVDFD